ncbi:uncharacterized protein PHACADRAFT_202111, partial [Phanerochaete carnosa HHB-10118-sp]
MGATWALFLIFALPWDKNVWQQKSGVAVPIWEDNHDPALDMVVSTAQKAAIKDFVERVRGAKGKDEAEAIWGCRSKGKGKNNKEGDEHARKTIQIWQKKVTSQSTWSVGAIVQEVLDDARVGYWEHLKQSDDPRDIDSVDVDIKMIAGQVQATLFEKLLDEEYAGKTIFNIKEREWVIALLTVILSRQKTHAKRALKTIISLEETVAASENQLKNRSLKQSEISKTLRVFTRSSNRLIKARLQTRREEDIEKNEKLSDVLRAVQSSMEGKHSSALSSDTHRLIVQMMSQEAVDDIENEINDALDHYKKDGEDLPFAEGDRAILADWNLDAELKHLTHKNPTELWQYLGIMDEKLVPLSDWRDPYLLYTTWTNHLECPEERKLPCNLKWHQLVGLCRLVEAVFDNKSLLVMDEVGVGKTLQVIALIAYRIMSLQSIEKNGEHLGVFKNKTKGTLKDGPVLIVVPPSLFNQWLDELQRWLKYGAVDIVIYTGQYNRKKCQEWWDAWKQMSTKRFTRVILATRAALWSNAAAAVKSKEDVVRPGDLPTLYHTGVGLFIADEIHDVRNSSQRLNAFIAMLRVVGSAVLLTATLMVTRPQDLLNIGKIMLIKHCSFAAIWQDFRRKINAAKRQDKRQRDEIRGEVTVDRARALLGRGSGPSELDKANKECIQDLQKIFTGYAIRQTIDNLDYQGNKIWGAEPPFDRYLFLKLNDADNTAIQELAEDSAGATGLEQNRFYLGVRKILAHPDYYHVDKDIDRVITRKGKRSVAKEQHTTWQGPQSLEEYRASPSTKLDATVTIIKHHIITPGAAPLVNSFTNGNTIREGDELWDIYNNTLIPDRKAFISRTSEALPEGPDEDPQRQPSPELPPDSEQASLWDTSTPDKLVVYVFFAAQQTLLRKVLEWEGITPYVLSGGMSSSKRADVLRAFREHAKPTVLIVTSVGIVGLSLDCANIVVFFSIMWSGQDDRQFIGRVWRSPQIKPIIIYRPLSMDLNEKNMSNIAFSKEEMHTQFFMPKCVADAIQRGIEKAIEEENEEDE